MTVDDVWVFREEGPFTLGFSGPASDHMSQVALAVDHYLGEVVQVPWSYLVDVRDALPADLWSPRTTPSAKYNTIFKMLTEPVWVSGCLLRLVRIPRETRTERGLCVMALPCDREDLPTDRAELTRIPEIEGPHRAPPNAPVSLTGLLDDLRALRARVEALENLVIDNGDLRS